MKLRVLLLPGLWNSGPQHWQSHWERERSDCRRVLQEDWEAPAREDWVATLDAEVRRSEGPLVLAAHSLACTLVAHWAAQASPESLARVRGALLVAPSDAEAPKYPPGPSGFAPMPRERLPFPSIVVYSTDDEYVTPERAREFAAAWGSRAVEAGPLGHINSASDLGMWPLGLSLLDELAGVPLPDAR
jgi:predicted alpha/beta hydrolase family esterase